MKSGDVRELISAVAEPAPAPLARDFSDHPDTFQVRQRLVHCRGREASRGSNGAGTAASSPRMATPHSSEVPNVLARRNVVSAVIERLPGTNPMDAAERHA